MSAAALCPPPSFGASVDLAREAMTAARESPIWQLNGDEVTTQLRHLNALAAQVDGVLLMLVDEISTRGLHLGKARTVGDFVAAVTGREPHAARGLADLADATLTGCEATGAALRAGVFSAAHGRAVVESLQALPAHVDVDTRDDVESLLIEQARVLYPSGVRRVGRHLRDTFARHAPDVDDPADGAAMDAADRAAALAAERRSLELTRRRDGMWRLTGVLDPLAGAHLATALEPLAAPARSADGLPDGELDGRTGTQRRADALQALVDLALDAGAIGEAGGERPHVTVLMDLGELTAMHAALGRVHPALLPNTEGTAQLDTGGALAPGELRALLCDARILPVVLGGPSQVLDVGRAARTFTTTQRRALAARDRGCIWPGCDVPVNRTHAHHLVHWADGGATDLDNAALLCPRHHRQLHRQHWEARIGSNGRPELVPPAFIDPTQQPRQHHRWRTPGHSRTDDPDP